jgi:hypothetical protein
VKDAEEVIAAATARGVFLMEALIQTLQKMLREQEMVDGVHRTFCDFLAWTWTSLRCLLSRYNDPALGLEAFSILVSIR